MSLFIVLIVLLLGTRLEGCFIDVVLSILEKKRDVRTLSLDPLPSPKFAN